jgi:DNA-3-methyladenine glycosylase I
MIWISRFKPRQNQGIAFVPNRSTFSLRGPMVTPLMTDKVRCAWAGNDPLMIAYHDEEWGLPVHDDQRLFEFLVLEGAQAGLSWSTILKKRSTYRVAFDNFDVAKVAGYDAERIAQLLQDPGIVRNILKVNSAVTNARLVLAVQKEFGSFSDYIWRFVGNSSLRNRRQSMRDIPAKTPEAEAMSKDLLRRGFKFVGPTICYAFMQAVGMVNDHLTTCFRFRQLGGSAR